MKQFDIPTFYKSSFIGKVKELRKTDDPRKKDFTPTLLDFGSVRIYVARHFGFCYGVENAVEISYKALEENPGKRIYLLSQMIHNQVVNDDLESRGIRFIQDTKGNQFVPWDEITADDVVITPAFGTTIEIEKLLVEKGVEVQRYNTTCPFVERVWKKSEKLGAVGHTLLIHGKPTHEETRATFSHSQQNGPSLVLEDMSEAQLLGKIILGELTTDDFYRFFEGRYSEGFDPVKDLEKVGVINQTTMLASDTQAIADHIKEVITKNYGEEHYKDHFADTRDTLCYATNDNQQATFGLLEQQADLAIVVGGYNSSNTTHLVELCEQKFPTLFINSPEEMESESLVHHFDIHAQERKSTSDWLPENQPATIILTSGASCPDSLMDAVLDRLLTFFPEYNSKETVLENL